MFIGGKWPWNMILQNDKLHNIRPIEYVYVYVYIYIYRDVIIRQRPPVAPQSTGGPP